MGSAVASMPISAPVNSADDGTLIAAALGGDSSAFEALYRRHVGPVYGICLRMTADTGAAEDCVQECFVRAWQKLESFRGGSKFSTWLCRIAINEVLMLRRRADSRPRLVVLDYEPAGASDTNPGGARDLEQAIEKLPRGARDVFVLAGIYGFSHKETSAALGVAVGTCKAQYHRAKKLLREELQA